MPLLLSLPPSEAAGKRKAAEERQGKRCSAQAAPARQLNGWVLQSKNTRAVQPGSQAEHSTLVLALIGGASGSSRFGSCHCCGCHRARRRLGAALLRLRWLGRLRNGSWL